MPEPTSIRRANLADTEQLDRLNQLVQAMHADALPQTFTPPTPLAAKVFFDDALRRDDVVVFVAESGTDLVGYLFAEEQHRFANAFMNRADVLNVHHIAVDLSHRRQGIGRALLDAASALAAERGLTEVRLTTWAFNDGAQRFFTKLGFAVVQVHLSRPA